MTRYLCKVYRIEIPDNGKRRDDLTEATEDWMEKLGENACFMYQLQGSSLMGIGAELLVTQQGVPGNQNPTA